MSDIWANGYEVPLIILSGPADAGKTLFSMMIAPKPAGEEANHLMFDLEQGSANVARQFAVKRIDLHSLVPESTDMAKRNRLLFEEWWKQADVETQAHRYDVLTIDPVDVLIKGAFEHVVVNAVKFGLKPALLAKDKRTAWGEAKTLLTNYVNILMSRVGTIVAIAHQRNKFVAGNDFAPKEKEARIHEAWIELATLHLHMYRNASEKILIKGTSYDACPKYPIPMAIVMKARHLDRIDFKTSKVSPLLPARLPECTPATMRGYMEKPFKVTEELEMPDVIPGIEETLTEEEKTALALEQAREQEAIVIASEKNRLYTELVLEKKLLADQVAMAAKIKELGFNNYEDMRAKLGSAAASDLRTWFPKEGFEEVQDAAVPTTGEG